MKKLFLLIYLVFLALQLQAENRRTFIILQDNSGSYYSFSKSARADIFNNLVDLLNNKKNILDKYSLISRELEQGELFFDPAQDNVHFYWFVADQANNVDFYRYSDGSYKSFEKYFLQLSGSKYSSGEDIGAYLRNIYSSKPQLNSQSNSDGIYTYSFTSFAYPLCLDVLPTEYSKEYIVILISDFMAGSTFGNKQDEKIIRDAFRQKAQDVLNRVSQLNSQFVKIDLGEYYKDADNSGILGFYAFKLRPNAGYPNPENIEVRLDSDIHFVQNEYEQDLYGMEPAKVVFKHSNSLKIDKAYIEFTMPGGAVVKKDVTSQMHEKDGVFNFAAINDIQFPGMTGPMADGALMLKYKFDASFCVDKSNQQAIKYTFETNRTIDNSNFTFKTKLSPMELYGSIAVILLIASLVALFLWKRRGKQCKISADIKIGTVSNERFLRVKDNVVTNLDCWYWDGVYHERGITVQFLLDIAQPGFSKKYKYALEARVSDLDANYDFTFRPNPTKHHAPQGGTYSANQWVPIDFEKKEFHVTAFLDKENTEQPNFENDNILKMGITLRVKRVLDNGKVEYMVLQNGETSIKEEYEFIVRPKLDNSNLWVAFDPGTSGSCIAYGIAGSPTDTKDLFVAQNTAESLRGSNIYSSIFPSKIKIIKESSRLAQDTPIKAEELVEGVDFDFGNRAEMLWGNFNCFQSIKKLLGYENSHKILLRHNGKDDIKEISGKDLAHLLVKGLCNRFDKYIVENIEGKVDRVVREQFLADSDGTSTSKLAVERAIVAVPNSYTLDKIQEMVDSVARTDRFKEVHYIYESEAVFMTYLRENWAKIGKLQHDRIFVVYDMGGATINITAFKLKVDLDKNNNVERVYVRTLSKIGYTIGGDDVDYALVQMIYDIPSVREMLKGMMSETDNWDDFKLNHQQLNKDKLLKFVREIKIDIISHYRNDSGSENQMLKIQDVDTFYGEVVALFKEMGIYLDAQSTDADRRYLDEQEGECSRKVGCPSIDCYVLRQVRDAIDELLKTIPAEDRKYTMEIIFSGRSVLYPNIKNNVYKVISEHKFKVVEWNGLKENGVESAELVKTAVAKGACWFAMYNAHIRLDHSVLTTTLGFIDNQEAKDVFVPLLKAGQHFDEYRIESKKVEPIYRNLRDVKFVQMMGADYNTIWRTGQSHKYSLLARQRQDVIIGDIEYISMSTNECGVVECAIKLMMNNEEMRMNLAGAMRLDITDDNSPAYIFATTNTVLNNFADGGATEGDLHEATEAKVRISGRRNTASKRI